MVTAKLALVSINGEPADETAGAARIAGAKIGKTEWWFRPHDRMVLQVTQKNEPDDEGKLRKVVIGEEVGTVPLVTGWVTKKDEDGNDTTVEYRLRARNDRCVVVTEDDLDRGTWAGRVGQERPGGPDARLAFAQVIRAEARDEAPEVSAVPYMDADGSMILPEADTQNIGYRDTAGDEAEARAAWRRILQLAAASPKTLLMLGAFFAGPLVAPLNVVSQIVNLTGEGQQGKSTTQYVQAAMFGRAAEGILRSWNSSAQGHPQTLRRARYLPLALEENSAGGLNVAKTEAMMSAMVAGANRAMGSADGNGGMSVGRWRSVISSSTNETLRRPGQTEDLASRLYEVSTPFWHDMWVDRDGQEVPEGTQKAMHLADWLQLTAQRYRGWPLEWAYRAGMLSAEGIERARDLHNEARYRITPKGGGIPGTIGKVHALWAVGAHLLGEAVGHETQLGPIAEAEAVRQLPDALTASASAALTPAEQLWEIIAAAMAKEAHFPALDLTTREAASVLDQDMKAHGSDVHGFHSGRDQELWIITGKLREIAKKAEFGDRLHAGLAGLKEAGVLKAGGGRNLPALPPRILRPVRGLGSRLYRFDLTRALEVFVGEQEEGGGPGGGGPDGGPDGGGTPTCRGYLTTGQPCGLPLTFDPEGTGLHVSCNETPYGADWPAGSIGAEEAMLPEEPEEEPEPEARPVVPAQRLAPVPAPTTVEGPHAAFLEEARTRRKQALTDEQVAALAARLETLDQAEAELSAMDDEAEEKDDATRKWSGKLRLLAAMEGSKDEPGAFTPRLRRREPFWIPPRPGMIETVQVAEGWSWSREYAGEVDVLDRNGSWPTAVSSVRVAHGGLEHTGEVDEVAGSPRPGYYLVRVYPWTEEGMPSPLGNAPVGQERWITAQKAALLSDLVTQGRWPDVHASDSYTSDPVRLSDWACLLGEVRRYALQTHGRDSDAYAVQKESFGQSMGLMYGTWDESSATPRRRWNCRSRRVDWVHAIKDQASGTIWRAADAVRRLGESFAPVALESVDEMVLPAGALAAATAGEKPLLRMDDLGVTFGTWKVKETKVWEG